MYGTHWIGANPTFALDSAQDNKLTFDVAEDLTADRLLNLKVGDADRTLDLTPTADHALMYDAASAAWKSKDVLATLTNIFKADGSRDMTGQIVSTFAGPPLVVADSSLVVQFNADQVDGKHAAQFADQIHLHAFSGLTDTPVSYFGAALKFLRVNSGSNAIEFIDNPTSEFTGLSDTPPDYTLSRDKTVNVNATETGLEFVGPFLDQDVRSAASPAFAGLTINGSVVYASCATFNISDAPGNTAMILDGTLSVGSTCNIVGLFTVNGKILSNLADGTPPITVTSETECPKLNAARVGGKTVDEITPSGTVIQDGVNDSEQSFTSSSDSVSALVLSTSSDVASAEYVAEGVFEGSANQKSKWTVDLLDPANVVLKTITVQQAATGQGNVMHLPWRLTARDGSPNTGAAGYHVKVTKNSGAATLKVLSARLLRVTS